MAISGVTNTHSEQEMRQRLILNISIPHMIVYTQCIPHTPEVHTAQREDSTRNITLPITLQLHTYTVALLAIMY